jgi:hypothetical protein
VRQHVRVVIGGEQRVERDGYDAAVNGPEERNRPFDAVVREQQYALFTAQAVLAQHAGELRDAARELAVTEARAVVDVCDAPVARGVARDQVLREVECRWGCGRSNHDSSLTHVAALIMAWRRKCDAAL